VTRALADASRRTAAYVWAAPTSLIGLAVITVSGATCQLRRGVLEAYGPGVAWWFDRLAPTCGIAAMTLGHVVLGRDRDALDGTRRHERAHVRQCERWGPLFLPAYACASLVAWAAAGDPYFDNAFERDARRRAGEPEPSRA
jgi:hypothetical protein